MTTRTTTIAWTEHTMNFWWGCNEVSPGCDHCYARTLMTGWGKDFHTVRRTAPATWAKASAWERQAITDGQPHRVFTCSMGDFFHEDADAWRGEAWDVIRATPHLTWQVLTKRAGRIVRHLPADWGPGGWPHVWLGTSVESAPEWWRVARYLAKAPAAVRFISYEPTIGPLFATSPGETWAFPHPKTGEPVTLPLVPPEALAAAGVAWLICGGESGSNARPMELAWVETALEACRRAGVAFFFKQTGAVLARRLGLRDRKGEDPREWPAALAAAGVREYPRLTPAGTRLPLFGGAAG